MQQPNFITDTRPDFRGMDFEVVFEEGLRYVRELSGKRWTDYNAHDPGVTILETLCYALTDLSYRIALGEREHLIGPMATESAFLDPLKALTTGSVTASDRLKTLSARCRAADERIRGLRLRPRHPRQDITGTAYRLPFTTLEGLYQCMVRAEAEEHDLAEIRKTILSAFAAERGLCEDLSARADELTVLRPLDVFLQGKIVLESGAEPEEVVAKLFARLNARYNPATHALTRADFKTEDLYGKAFSAEGTTAEISAGAADGRIYFSLLAQEVGETEGVALVTNVAIGSEDDALLVSADFAEHEDDRLPVFVWKAQLDKLIVEQNGKPIQLQPRYVAYFADTLAGQALVSANEQTALIEVEQDGRGGGAEFKETVGQYFSIRNDFPRIYGLDNATSVTPRDASEAQTGQFKAYLLFFEQMLSDVLAQLREVHRLYSPQVDKTYFFDSMANYGGHADGLPIGQEIREGFALLVYHERKAAGEALPEESDLDRLYEERYGQLYAGLQTQDRRHRFLDYMLALQGERTLDPTLLEEAHFYAVDEAQARHAAAETKAKLLRTTVRRNRERSKGIDYAHLDDISPLEECLSILGHIRHLNRLPDEQEGASDEEAYQWEPLGATSAELPLDTELAQGEGEQAATERERLVEGLTKWLPKQPEAVVARLAEPTAYRVVVLREDEQDDEAPLYWGVRLAEDGELQDLLGLESDIEDRTPGFLAACLLEAARRTEKDREAFFAVEHILLRPDADALAFGLAFVSEGGERRLAFESQEAYSYKERERRIRALKQALRKAGPAIVRLSVEQAPGAGYRLRIAFESEEADLPPFDCQLDSSEVSVEAVYEQAERFVQRLSEPEADLEACLERRVFADGGEGSAQVPERFLSLRLTFVLTGESLRTRRPEYRRAFEGAARDRLPAHLRAGFLWCERAEEERRLRTLYRRWRALLAERFASPQDKDLQEARAALLAALYKLGADR